MNKKTIKEFLKPTKKKILLLIIFIIHSIYSVYSVAAACLDCDQSETVFYNFSKISTFFWFFIFCLIIFIYDEFKTKFKFLKSKQGKIFLFAHILWIITIVLFLLLNIWKTGIVLEAELLEEVFANVINWAFVLYCSFVIVFIFYGIIQSMIAVITKNKNMTISGIETIKWGIICFGISYFSYYLLLSLS